MMSACFGFWKDVMECALAISCPVKGTSICVNVHVCLYGNVIINICSPYSAVPAFGLVVMFITLKKGTAFLPSFLQAKCLCYIVTR